VTPKFIRTSVPEKETLGEKLAKKRAALGYDLKEAERATRIRAKYIEFLESGRYEKLPPDVYVQGFLKIILPF
jgi:cytoskeletal protein RodZ